MVPVGAALHQLVRGRGVAEVYGHQAVFIIQARAEDLCNVARRIDVAVQDVAGSGVLVEPY